MMGDEMAIRSGGVYRNPESQYTKAMPSGFSGAGTMVSGFGQLLNMWGTSVKYRAENRQMQENINNLLYEKQYNLENYKQRIADTVAKNKMSFYASGLDINSGTPQDVITNNERAMQEDMGLMQRNYDIEIANLKKQKKARRIGFNVEQFTNVANFISSAF